VKISLNILGAMLALAGTVWFLQGINILPGSFMSGKMQWAINGGIAVVVGLAVLLWNNRSK